MKQMIQKFFSCLMAMVLLVLPLAGFADTVLPLANGQTLCITEMENDLVLIEDFDTPLGIVEEQPAFSLLLLIATVLLVGTYAVILIHNQRKLNAMRRLA